MRIAHDRDAAVLVGVLMTVRRGIIEHSGPGQCRTRLPRPRRNARDSRGFAVAPVPVATAIVSIGGDLPSRSASLSTAPAAQPQRRTSATWSSALWDFSAMLTNKLDDVPHKRFRR
jgi:hypothetical protein